MSAVQAAQQERAAAVEKRRRLSRGDNPVVRAVGRLPLKVHTKLLIAFVGTAVLLVSAELDEVLELSDRIGVMYRGELVAVVDGRSADREDVGLLMATGGRKGAPPVTAASA